MGIIPTCEERTRSSLFLLQSHNKSISIEIIHLNMSSYQSIVVTNVETESLVSHSPNHRSRSHRPLAVVLAILLIAGVSVVVFFNSKNGAAQQTLPLMGEKSPSTLACSFAICETSGCPVNISPYACFGWTDPNLKTIGCAPMPWIVGAIGSTCIESCDLSNCKNAVPDDVSLTCEGVLCDDCKSIKCGSGAPFQCLEGSSRYACSSDAYYYNLLPKTQCHGCCDTRECSK